MNRPVRLTECNKCHLPILTGVDDRALDVRADLIPLTRHGEIQAMITGRTCWRIDNDRRCWRTDIWRIQSDAPMPSDHRIAAHVCGQPTPADWHAPPRAPVHARTLDPDTAPF